MRHTRNLQFPKKRLRDRLYETCDIVMKNVQILTSKVFLCSVLVYISIQATVKNYQKQRKPISNALQDRLDKIRQKKLWTASHVPPSKKNCQMQHEWFLPLFLWLFHFTCETQFSNASSLAGFFEKCGVSRGVSPLGRIYLLFKHYWDKRISGKTAVSGRMQSSMNTLRKFSFLSPLESHARGQ